MPNCSQTGLGTDGNGIGHNGWHIRAVAKYVDQFDGVVAGGFSQTGVGGSHPESRLALGLMGMMRQPWALHVTAPRHSSPGGSLGERSNDGNGAVTVLQDGGDV
jgi:hypothetical protein